MMLSLHKNATMTPAIRAKIAASDEPASVLAARYSVTLDTIYRWRGRTSFEDRSQTAHQLATTLTRPQEAGHGDGLCRHHGVMCAAGGCSLAKNDGASLSRLCWGCFFINIDKFPPTLV
ncbi:hypothetical protein [Pseudorhodobacter antarcticus]|jgi:hypothetical protein|uniref:hypothetical protein n=1 Tax=Pseudorhodobacter antarcticus TaxID=1077947 RepID=UPI001C314175|nr:hypothetical protein [Pseudorhodobacter antarcticus]